MHDAHPKCCTAGAIAHRLCIPTALPRCATHPHVELADDLERVAEHREQQHRVRVHEQREARRRVQRCGGHGRRHVHDEHGCGQHLGHGARVAHTAAGERRRRGAGATRVRERACTCALPAAAVAGACP